MRARDLLRGRRLLLSAGVAASLLWTMTSLAGPALVRYGLDHGVRPGDVGALDRAVLAYAVVVVVAYALQRVQILLIARVGEGFLRDLRSRGFTHLQQLSMSFYDREKAGVVVSRMTSDIDSLAEVVQHGILQFATSGLLLVGSVVVLVVLSWQLALVVLAVLPALLFATRKFRRDSERAYLDIRDSIGLTLSSLQEGISGVRVVQAFAQEPAQIQRFATTNRSLLTRHVRSVFIQAWYIPCVEVASHVTMAGVVGVGGYLVHRGSISVGTVAAFVLLLNNLFEPVQNLSNVLNTVQSAAAALRKVLGLLDTPIDVAEAAGARPLRARGPLHLAGVSFAYPGGPLVLEEVELLVRPGERLAVVGPTGGGKSTLAKLVGRFYDPVAGSVSYGGVDLRHATQRSLRERIVVVPQEGYLFHGSLLDNIRVARADATEDEVWDALRSLGLEQRFAALPDGLGTLVDERGVRFSAGERQLVSLARAALVDPAVLVLDEATSSLDPGTELLVERAMERLFDGRSVLMIVHRLSSAARCDRVAVVQGGRVVELGTHTELLRLGGAYAGLHNSWTADLSA